MNCPGQSSMPVRESVNGFTQSLSESYSLNSGVTGHVYDGVSVCYIRSCPIILIDPSEY